MLSKYFQNSKKIFFNKNKTNKTKCKNRIIIANKTKTIRKILLVLVLIVQLLSKNLRNKIQICQIIIHLIMDKIKIRHKLEKVVKG